MKMTKKLLDNYQKLKREIPFLQTELEEMMFSPDAGMGNSTVFDYQTGYPRAQSVVGFDWPLYEYRKKVLENKKSQVKAVDDWINSIEDAQTRCVFRMRYIDGMNWVKIAAKAGYAGNPDYPRIVIRDRYLAKQKIK